MTDTALGRRDHLTFKGNLRETRYGWLRLTPAYSVHLVSDLLEADWSPGIRVLDPFCGTGTTALVCAEHGIPATTTDINPFLVWLAEAKTAQYTTGDLTAFSEQAEVVAAAIQSNSNTPEWVPPIYQIEKWWDNRTLHALARGMAAIRASDEDVTEGAQRLLRVAFCRAMIERANVSFGHQSMSFKKRVAAQAALFDDETPEALVAASWEAACSTIVSSATSPILDAPNVVLADARSLHDALPEEHFGLVITSPPYPNRMSYIRELRPYMYWLGYLADGREAGELDWQAIGGTWGCATSNVGKWSPPTPRPIPHPDFETILAAIRERSDVLARYVHKYFDDMLDHVASLSKVLGPDARIHYIVGNSKFYETLLPVEEIYAGLFEQAGFEGVEIQTIRKRSSKRELFEYLVSARKPA